MLRLIGNRIATSIPLLLIVTLIVFVLQAFVPGDAARTILGENANPQTVAALRDQLGLNEPLVSRYGDWLAGALHGDLGTSIISGVDVMSSLDTRLGVTLSLLVPSMLLNAVAGIALGFASAVRGGFLGRVIDVVSLLGFALPSFWIALLLVAALAERANLLPATGYTPFAESPGDWLRSIVLPVIALSLHGITAVAKQTRDSVAEVLEADYVRFLRANGVGTPRCCCGTSCATPPSPWSPPSASSPSACSAAPSSSRTCSCCRASAPSPPRPPSTTTSPSSSASAWSSPWP